MAKQWLTSVHCRIARLRTRRPLTTISVPSLLTKKENLCVHSDYRACDHAAVSVIGSGHAGVGVFGRSTCGRACSNERRVDRPDAARGASQPVGRWQGCRIEIKLLYS